jgi:hypothetical protein
MDEATIKFARAARNADVAIFYYSGHAVQFAGANYLIPIDVKLTDEADLRLMTKVDDIVADLQSAKSLRILVLDACRNNPMVEQMQQRAIGRQRAVSIQRGLARIDSPEGMIIAYSTQAGSTADDGRGRNSPYTAAFLRHVEEPEEIGTIFRRVAADVYETTGRAQIPELSLSLIGEFYLRGRLDITVHAQPPASDPCAAARDHWKSAEAIGTVAAFEDHVARFPNCPFVGLAKSKIAALTAGQLPDSRAHRFDGTWFVTRTCPPSRDGASGYTLQFIAEVKDGRFRGQLGEVGKPDSWTHNGSIDPDGTALISGQGLSGDPKFMPGHPPSGTPWKYIVNAKFQDSQGSGTQRGTGRTCNFVFDKKGYGLAAGLPSAAIPELDLRRFDGIWVAKVACESKAPVWPAESYQFTANVRDGVFHAQTGVEGMPRFRSYDGKIQLDGTAEILVRGLTGDTERDPINRPTGTEYRWKVAGKFEGSHGVGIRADERTCNFDFAMLTVPAATARTGRSGERPR